MEKDEIKKGIKGLVDNKYIQLEVFEFEGKLYTYDDIYNAYLRNESFVGKKINYENLKRFIKLRKLAEELIAAEPNFESIIIDKPENRLKWSFIHIDFAWMAMFDGKNRELLIKMLELSDDFSMNGSGKKIAKKNGLPILRMNFGIKNMWS